jgi:predicted transposase YdaD
VIYIKPCKVAEPFYEEHFPTGDLVRHFRYCNIKLWELRPEDIERLGLIGLYPLIVLTEGGSDPKVIEQVISRLEETGENTSKELLSLLYLLASFVIDKEDVLQWLKWRFFEMHNELRETWVYQEILREGREMERRTQLERQRLMLTRFVQQRYPTIVDLAKNKANSISDPEALEEIYVRVSLANSQEEAMAILT